jgi:enoyl-CoA hydratase
MEEKRITDRGGEADDCVVVEWPRPEIAVLRLNRPHHLNAIDECVAGRLPVVLHELRDAFPRCRAVILTGAGRGFCAGVDLSEIDREERSGSDRADSGSKDESGPDGEYPSTTQWSSARNWFLRTSVPDRLEGQERFAGMVQALRALPQPVIAAVNGPAVGAGLALALACDVRLGSASASFHVGAVKIGLSAGECGISYLLPRLVGASRAFEVMLTGRPIQAAEAEHIGLVSQVVAEDELLPAAMRVAEGVVANAPFAVWMTKELMWTNLDAASFDAALSIENRTQMLAFATADREEAVRAFLEKRPPVFVGS